MIKVKEISVWYKSDLKRGPIEERCLQRFEFIKIPQPQQQKSISLSIRNKCTATDKGENPTPNS